MKEAFILLMLITFKVVALSATTSGISIALPGCPDKCGNVSIPYPFGIGNGCAAANLNSYFTVTCNSTFQPPRPMIGNPSGLSEIIDISLERGEMRVYGPVSYNCFASNTTIVDNYTSGFNLVGTPFIPSTNRNRFMVIGCNTMGIIGGYLHSNPDLYVAGCYSYCQGINSTSNGAPCTGKGCCETTITPNLTDFAALLIINQSSVWTFNPCFYAMLAEVGATVDPVQAASLRSKKSHAMSVEMDSKVGFQIGKFKSKRINVRVLCSGFSAGLAKPAPSPAPIIVAAAPAPTRSKIRLSSSSSGGGGAATTDAKCKLRVKIWIWTF